jgi:hypothetical protein
MVHFTWNAFHLYLSDLNISKKSTVIISYAQVIEDMSVFLREHSSYEELFLSEISYGPFLLYEHRLCKMSSFTNEESGKKT